MSKLLKLYPTLIFGASLLPLMAGAAVTKDVSAIIRDLSGTLQNVVAILFVLATVIFIWGVIQFIVKSGDEQGRTKAKGIMTWGIIGLAVMAAAWGIVTVITNYFGVTGEGIPSGPKQ